MRNTKSKIGMSLMVVGALAWGGCASPGKKTAIGAGAGAATGAAIGGATGGWKGAGIGAAIGGVTGGAFGNYLDKQAQELEKVAQTKRTRDGILVQLKNDLLFETGSSTLKPDAASQLQQLGDILAKYDKDRVRVEGHTDNVGSDTINDSLSLKRAAAVKEILKSRGVSENQIMAIGQGESRPVANNATKQGRAANRRVELHIDVPQSS
jgi:outer membrane protein OmpA-like peptidoglycan-associated protein